MRSMLEEVTPLILTFNESPNIDRTLQHLNLGLKESSSLIATVLIKP
jgi:hypothetical protein